MGIEEKFEGGKPVLYVNYDGARSADQMIHIFDQAVSYLLQKNEPCLLLTNFGNSYITSPFMRHVESKRDMITHLIKRNAFIGLSDPKKFIVRGLKRNNHQAFDSEDEAIKFLLTES